jgi:hypothetical protein
MDAAMEWSICVLPDILLRTDNLETLAYVCFCRVILLDIEFSATLTMSGPAPIGFGSASRMKGIMDEYGVLRRYLECVPWPITR